MTDESAAELAEPGAPALAPGCAATLQDDLMVCERCGLDWPAGTRPPKCQPITFEGLATRMLSEIAAAEASLVTVRRLQAKGVPTDGGAIARRRLAELCAVFRLVDRVRADPHLRAALNGRK